MTAINPYLRKPFSIWRDAEQLVIKVEQAVRQFSRYHRYTLGTELRQLAMRGLRYVSRAIHQKERRMYWVGCLQVSIEHLLLNIQIGKSLQAFASFSVFEHIAKLAVSVAKQAQAWHKKLQGGTARRDQS